MPFSFQRGRGDTKRASVRAQRELIAEEAQRFATQQGAPHDLEHGMVERATNCARLI